MAVPLKGLLRGRDTGSWCSCGSQLAAVLLEEAADARDGAAASTAAPCWARELHTRRRSHVPPGNDRQPPTPEEAMGGGEGTASPSRAPGVPPAPELAPTLIPGAVHPSHTSQQYGNLEERELDKARTAHWRGHSAWWH